MWQQGQVFKLASTGASGTQQWAYRYRIGGRGGKRVQHGGFASEEDAQAASSGSSRSGGEGRTGEGHPYRIVEEYLAQHEASPVTLEKLRFCSTHAEVVFGDYRLDELARWRSPPGG